MNKITVNTDGCIELNTFGYKPIHPDESLLIGEDDLVRFWAVEFQDETTGQAVFQYGFTSISNRIALWKTISSFWERIPKHAESCPGTK